MNTSHAALTNRYWAHLPFPRNSRHTVVRNGEFFLAPEEHWGEHKSEHMRFQRPRLPFLSAQCIRRLITRMAAQVATTMAGVAASTTVQVVTDSKPSIVTIRTYDANKQQKGLATGFFISENEIVTNNHVVSVRAQELW